MRRAASALPAVLAAGAALLFMASPAGAEETVEEGDTVSEYAQAHSVDVNAIASCSGLADPDTIYPGDVLSIPGQDNCESEPAAGDQSEPTPEPEADNASYATSEAGGDVWTALAECESSGDWSIDSTYDGGLQFHPDTWTGYGGEEFAAHAYDASPQQQIIVAERVLAEQGWDAWPACASELGLR